jgi:hypothetical protein
MMREEGDMPLQGISQRVESEFCIHEKADPLESSYSGVLKSSPELNLRKWEKPQAG